MKTDPAASFISLFSRHPVRLSLGLTALLATLMGLPEARATYSGGTNFVQIASFGTPSFGSSPGLNPFAEMLQGSDGNLYGTTESGGANGSGGVYRIGPLAVNPTANGLVPTTIASFSGTNGADPRSPLVFGPDGNFYGSTYSGGLYGLGTLFMVTTAGELVNLASFDGTNGSGPMGALVFAQDAAGTYSLYGTTFAGGANGNYGTVFSLGFPNGFLKVDSSKVVLTSEASFDGPTYGSQPWGGVTMGGDGNLYGTTAIGGGQNGGTLFMYELASGYHWGGFSPGMNALYYFAGTDGTNSQASLVLGPDNATLYGTTLRGGSYNGGTIFSLPPLTNYTTAAITTLWSFGSTNGSGSNCTSRLLVGADTQLYGTTQAGGARGYGTIFSCSTNGSFALLYSLQGGRQGYGPVSGLTQSTNGNFYGVTKYGGTAANSPGLAYELGGFAPYIISLQPTNLTLTIVTNSSGSMTVAAGGSAPLTYHWQRNTNNIGNSTSYSGANSTNLTITAGRSTNTFYYDVTVQNNYGGVTSSIVVVSIANSFGTNPPLVKILSPKANAESAVMVSSLHVMVDVNAVPDTLTQVSTVFYSLNGATPQPAPEISSGVWSAQVTLHAGTNIFQTYAQDSLTHYSATNTIYLVPSLFVPVAGVYNGLFLATNGVAGPTNAGAFSVTVTTAGSYSGTLQMAGTPYKLSGKLGSNGVAQASAKAAKAAMDVSFWLDLTTNSDDRILGAVSNTNGTWQASLSGDLEVYDGKNNLCPWAGQFNYTLYDDAALLDSTNLTLTGTNFSISGGASGPLPAGGSYGTVKVSSAGIISFSCSLSDGTTFSQSSSISRRGLWPFYTPLYSGRGLLWGWQSFPTNVSDVFRGDVAWIKPAAAAAKGLYTNGFTARAFPFGDYYVAPTVGQDIFASAVTNAATFIAVGGGLPMGITNYLTISPKNQVGVSPLSPELGKLSLNLVSSSGSFSGSFTLSGAKSATSFKGLILENTNSTGFFTGTNQSGQVWLTVP